MGDAHAVAKPIDGNHAPTPSKVGEPRTNQCEYQKCIGSLMYAMVGTRPGIAYAISKLSQYCQDPAVWNGTALDRVLLYQKNTAELALVFDNIANKALAAQPTSWTKENKLCCRRLCSAVRQTEKADRP